MNWANFFSMDGRAFYVWGSFGAFTLAIIAEIIILRLRTRRAKAQIGEQVQAGNLTAGAR